MAAWIRPSNASGISSISTVCVTRGDTGSDTAEAREPLELAISPRRNCSVEQSRFTPIHGLEALCARPTGFKNINISKYLHGIGASAHAGVGSHLTRFARDRRYTSRRRSSGYRRYTLTGPADGLDGWGIPPNRMRLSLGAAIRLPYRPETYTMPAVAIDLQD